MDYPDEFSRPLTYKELVEQCAATFGAYRAIRKLPCDTITITDPEIVELIKNAPDDDVVMLGPEYSLHIVEIAPTANADFWIGLAEADSLPEPDVILDAKPPIA